MQPGTGSTDPEAIARIRSLAIPPAYEDVRISPDPRAHLQAVGRDQAGRLQHRYHPEWNEVREDRKAQRLAALLEVLPRIREAVAQRPRDAPSSIATRRSACAIALIDDAHIRVGCEAYARDNGSHGAATLLKRHVSIRGARISLAFRGKGGKDIACSMEDERLAECARAACARCRGRRLLQFEGADGASRRRSAASDVNAYLQRVSGADVTAKDFRMLGASASAAARAGRDGARPNGGRPQAPARRRHARGRGAAGQYAGRRAQELCARARRRSFQNGALKKAHRLARSGRNRKRVENALARLVAKLRKR